MVIEKFRKRRAEMGIASGIKELTQDIASSHEDRLKKIEEIKEEAKQVRGEAQNLVESFQTSRKDTGAQLRSDLAQDKAHRKSEANGILRAARGLITVFKTSRREASSRLRKDLSATAADRRSEVRQTLENAQEMIKGFQASRKGMGSELRKELAESSSARKSDVGELLKKAQDLIKDFGVSRKKTGSELRKELAQSTTGRKSEVKKMRREFAKAQAEVRDDLKEAAAAWQGLAKAMPVKGAEVKVPPKAEVPVAKEEMPDLEARLLALITLHPEGITLAEVAEKFGVAPVVLRRASKSLVEKGKIRKGEKAYFPITTGEG